MKRQQNRLIPFIRRILEARLRTRMLLLYIAGGALPMVLIGLYLVSGTNKILVEREKQAEMGELEILGRELRELLNNVNTASKNFYFDEKLEEIAVKDYKRYEELVADYRAYTAFDNVGNLYNRAVVWTSVYLDNDTITENAHFRKATEDIQKERWYTDVLAENGGAVWQTMPLPLALDHQDTLALTRLVRTRDSRNVGVLVMYLRKARLKEQVDSRLSHTRIVLNGEEEIISNGAGVEFAQIQPIVQGRHQEGIFQEKADIEGTEYVMTCYSFVMGESEDMMQIISMKSYKDILLRANRQNRGSVVLFLASAVISMTMIALFSWSFGNRVDRFRRQMQKAASGDFDLEPSLGGQDEISELYGYLGTMIADIQRLLAEIYRERIHAEQLKTQQKEAEFKVLASQINPHFLYNTLETIRMKARLNHEPEIEDLVKMLAKILRKNIRSGGQEVTVEAEVELVESYLKIQKYRFDERIQYQIQVDQEVREYKILPLIMQPIVENSIVHGLETKEGIGHILISVRQVEDEILITIEDDGLGISEERLKEIKRELNRKNPDSSHIGVRNAHQRLRLKYGEPYGLTIVSTQGEMTKVVMRIPKI